MPDTVRAGEVTVVTVGITNVSDEPQTYESNFCGQAYHIYNSAGKKIDNALPCLALTAPKTLAPGAQDLYSTEWTTAGGSPATALPAGSYTIRGALDGDGVENLPFTVQVVP